ncbi:MAG: MFS transporter [Promethearchaeota archaeon]
MPRKEHGSTPGSGIIPATSAKGATMTTYALSFLGDVSIGLFSFSISLLTTIMADSLGFSGQEEAFWISVVATGWGAVYWFSPVLLGHISDKIGRKNSLILAMAGFSIINLLVMLFATHPIHLFIAFAASAFVFGFYFPVLGALSSELSEARGSSYHSKVLSRFMISWSIGLTMGPLIGGFVAAFLTYYVVFLVLICNAAIIMMISYFGIPARAKVEAIKKGMLDGDTHLDNDGHRGLGVPSSKEFLRFLKIVIFTMPFLFSFINQIYFSYFPGYATEHMRPGWVIHGSPELIAGILIFLLGTGRTITFYHAGKMKTASKVKLVIISPIIMAVATLGVYAFPNADMLVFTFPVYGLFSGYTFSIGLILLMEISSTGKGLKAGLYEASVGVGTLLSTLISIFISTIDPGYPFLLSALCGFASFIILISFYTIARNSTHKTTV